MCGIGTYIWPDGRKYVGIQIYKQKLGSFENDLRNGFGTFTWQDGKEFRGEWKDGRQHGKGVMSCQGQQQEGVWHEGHKVE